MMNPEKTDTAALANDHRRTVQLGARWADRNTERRDEIDPSGYIKGR